MWTRSQGDRVASVAIDPRNGEVLAMISVPSFDPNLFVNGISQTDYNALLHSPDKPLLDRALRGSYVPGSTIKPFLAAAGLELGLRRPSDTILSTGEFIFRSEARVSRRQGGRSRQSGPGRVVGAVGQRLLLLAGPGHGYRSLDRDHGQVRIRYGNWYRLAWRG